MNRNPLEEEIKKTLESLDGISRAPARNYFYARLQARITNENSATRWFEYFLQPRLGLAAVVVLVFLNAGAILWLRTQKHHEKNYLESLASEINPAGNAYQVFYNF